jgi:hypothetical protein
LVNGLVLGVDSDESAHINMTDAFPMYLRTSNQTRLTLAAGGNATFSHNVTCPSLVIDNGFGDGGELRWKSSGFNDHWSDNINGTLRFFEDTYGDRLDISSTEFVVNGPSGDKDFRVGAVGQTHAIFVRGSDARVGIGTSGPGAALHVVAPDSNIWIGHNSGALKLQGDYYHIITNQLNELRINANGDTDHRVTVPPLNVGTGWISFYTAAGTALGGVNASVEAMRIDATGHVGIGITNPGSYPSYANSLVLGGTTGHRGMIIRSAADSVGYILFADADTDPDASNGLIGYNQLIQRMFFSTGNGTRLSCDSSRVTVWDNIDLETGGTGTHTHDGNAVAGYLWNTNVGASTGDRPYYIKLFQAYWQSGSDQLWDSASGGNSYIDFSSLVGTGDAHSKVFDVKFTSIAITSVYGCDGVPSGAAADDHSVVIAVFYVNLSLR